MAGQSTQLSRSESITMQKKIERGPGKTMGGSSMPNRGSYPKGTGVAVPTK